MHNYGEVFKQLRKNKKLSLKETSIQIVSSSFLSKVERGKTNLTLPIFFQLLNRLNISIEEFVFINFSYQPSEFEKLMNTVQAAYEKNNIQILIALEKKEHEKYLINRNYYLRLNSIMIKYLIYDIDTSYKVPIEDIQYLTDYLFRIEEWGYYELIIFGNSLGVLTTESILLFTDEILNKTKLFKNSKKYKEELIKTLQNIVTICLERNQYKVISTLFMYIDDLLKNSKLYFEKTKLLYLKGIYKIHLKDQSGVILCKNAIEIMHQLGDTTLSENHKSYLDVVIKKYLNK